jgi:hypothetical protein
MLEQLEGIRMRIPQNMGCAACFAFNSCAVGSLIALWLAAKPLKASDHQMLIKD